MKKFFTLLCLWVFALQISNAQLVITEISYNPPESGADSLEYIELHNRGNAAINLKDYKFTKGIEFTFPDISISSGAYLLLSVNEGACLRNYKKASLQWTAGALNNGGETVAIADVSGNEILSVDYKDVAPWPGLADGTDGDGKSIEICDVSADPNNGANWKVSKNNLGFSVAGKPIFGTPGEKNSNTSCTSDPTPSDPYPLRTIPQMKGVNAEGVADSLGKKCALRGIVYGVNHRPTGLQFTIIDAQNKGFGVFNNDKNLGYTVKEGDEILVKGGITQFRGLSQIVADSIKLISSNNALVIPKTVTELTETDESSLVTVRSLTFINPSEWTGAGTGFTVNMTNGTKEFPIRITNAIDAFSLPIPGAGPFHVVGILNQFSGTSAPFNTGYQLQPRYLVDFIPVSGTDNFYSKHPVTLSPNPATHLVEINTVETPDLIEVTNIQGQTVITSKQTKTLDLNNISQGLYFINIAFGNQNIVLKLIKM